MNFHSCEEYGRLDVECPVSLDILANKQLRHSCICAVLFKRARGSMEETRRATVF